MFSEYTHDLSFSLGFHDIFRGYFMGERILGGGKGVAKWAEKLELTLAHKNTRIQCPLDIETLDKAAALDLATSKAVTDLRQYINSDLGFSDLKMCFFI